MPEVKISHRNIKDEDAAKKPPRIVVPIGRYCALIVQAALGATRGTPPLQKVSVAFQILYAMNDDGSKDETYKGRQVYQDYIPEHDASNEELSKQRRWELRSLLDATETPFTDGAFNTDHLLNKSVIITVKHRPGREVDDDGKPVIFTGVGKVDTVKTVDDADII